MTEPVAVATGVGVVGWILNKMLGPSADVLGEEIKQRFAGYLGRNRRATLELTAEQVKASGKAPREVPLRVLLPVLERSGYEDNEELQMRWAALLANAATAEDPDAVSPAFVAILSQLTPDAAVVLDALAVLEAPLIRRDQIVGGLANSEPWGVELFDIIDHIHAQRPNPEPGRTSLALGVAKAAGLIDTEPPIRQTSTGYHVLTDSSSYRLTTLGRAFVAACRPHKPEATKPG